MAGKKKHPPDKSNIKVYMLQDKNQLLQELLKKGVKTTSSKYLTSEKNIQTKNVYTKNKSEIVVNA